MFTSLSIQNLANIMLLNKYDYRYLESLSTKETVQTGYYFTGYFSKRETLGMKWRLKKRLYVFGGCEKGGEMRKFGESGLV